MKRDLDLIRKILLSVESDTTNRGFINVKIEGYTPDQIFYHVALLKEAGYIEAKEFSGDDKHEWYPTRLTWNGHEFLDAARDETIWTKMQAEISKVSGTMALPVVLALLIELGKRSFGLQ